MRFVLFLLLFWAVADVDAGWRAERECYVPDAAPDRSIRFRMNEFSTRVWHFMDLTTAGVASDAVSAVLQGVLVITHGMTPETCAIRALTKHPDAPRTPPFDAAGVGQGAWNSYGQVVEAHVGGGQRSTWTFVAPVARGGFDFWYEATWVEPRPWPNGCAFAVTLWVQRWCR